MTGFEIFAILAPAIGIAAIIATMKAQERLYPVKHLPEEDDEEYGSLIPVKSMALSVPPAAYPVQPTHPLHPPMQTGGAFMKIHEVHEARQGETVIRGPVTGGFHFVKRAKLPSLKKRSTK